MAEDETNNVIDDRRSPDPTLPQSLKEMSLTPTLTPTSLKDFSMPNLDLSDINLHSPSSQIVGTPFATSSVRFEYPFPDTPPPSASTSDLSTSFPTLSSPVLTALSPSPSPSNFPNLTHPKMRQAPPPVPPGLAKKKFRWSLGLLGRRRSSYGAGDDNDPSPNIIQDSLGKRRSTIQTVEEQQQQQQSPVDSPSTNNNNRPSPPSSS